MNSTMKSNLPPNPYRRSPIKKLEGLAGRDSELKTIRYYLRITASGQSPHLALLGQRGVGKTSLLNGAESIAKELKLLPVRLDMNEQKAKSPGRFWHDMYQTLVLTMAKAGCWGGTQGIIYAELLRMFYARQPGSIEKAVLQIPYVFSCHQGSIDDFDCPDALIRTDFEVCLVELENKGFNGIALLIDEADCLGQNVPLLQMFRNIFQVVERCSLLLAGTDAVFPALSEVFSPIPRQFHRVDVKPFAHWSVTMELVLYPLSKDFANIIAPEPSVIRELHELCGGAPDEVQLYCHHMYRNVEDGSSKQMVLSPQVFRGVLREYRSNTPTNIDAVLNAIERLPDKLLCDSNWLSRRKLTLDENIRVSILRQELKLNRMLTVDERSEIISDLTEGYCKLFEAGISETDNHIQLVGTPLTAGFWKSFVNVERGKRWAWDDRSFAYSLYQSLTNAIGRACKISGRIDNIHGKNAVEALQTLRNDEIPQEFDEGMREMIGAALFALEKKTTKVIDVTFQIDSPAGKQTFQSRFFEHNDVQLTIEHLHEWIENNRPLLASNEVEITVVCFDRWELPSPDELHRLGRISGYRIPEAFGPNEMNQAIIQFKNGKIEECMNTFSKMLADKEESSVRNNLAFCQLLSGNIIDGLLNATKAVEKDYHPLYELNKGIGEFLIGNMDLAGQSLRNALQQILHPANDFDVSVLYVLVLEPEGKKVNSHEELPIDAAILINLFRMGDSTKDELHVALAKHYPEKVEAWLAIIVPQET